MWHHIRYDGLCRDLSFAVCYPEIQRMGTRVMACYGEMHHVHGFDSNGGGNITRERDFAKPWTRPVLIKRLKKAMCAFCVA